MVDLSAPTGVARDASRFLLAGLTNAALTFTAYQLLLFVLAPGLAYTGAWVCGLAFVVAVYPSKVFPQGRTGRGARIGMALSYVLVFVIGIVSLEALERMGVPPRFAIILVMMVTTVANFVFGRTLLRGAAFGRLLDRLGR